MAVAGQCELAFEFGLVKFLLDLEMKGVTRQESWRCQPVQRGGGWHDDHIGAAVLVALADAPQRGQTFADQVLVWRESVVGQGFPVGKQRAAQRGRKKDQLVEQALRTGRIGGNDGGQTSGRFFLQPQLRQQQGIGRTGGLWQGVAFAGQ